jgi:hypothetical protein
MAMKRNLLILVAVFGICSLSCSFCFAQAPQRINYQAVARNTSGNVLANQQITVRLTIHNNTPNGAIAYIETDTVITNQFGLFTIAIGGATTIPGGFSGISWGSGNKYLEVEMDPAAGSAFVDMGTSQLLSVPYALYAANGPVGPTGPTGAQGITGSQGISGSTGPTGATSLLTGNIEGFVLPYDSNFCTSCTSLYTDYNTAAGTIISIDGTTYATTANSEGKYTFTNIPQGTYSLTFTKGSQYAPMKANNISHVGGGTTLIPLVSICWYPTHYLTAFSATISGGQITLSGTSTSMRDQIAIYIGTSSSVSSAPGSFKKLFVLGTNNYSLLVNYPVGLFTGLGFYPSQTVYFRAYGINTSGNSYYIDNQNGQPIYPAVSSSSMLATLTLP